jgi:methylated-DNA-[protein]-cysteine S-methyltransferase
MSAMHTTTLPTPLGPFSLVVDEDGVRAAGFVDDPATLRGQLPSALRDRPLHPIDELGPYSDAVRAYFDGDVAALDTIPVPQPEHGFHAAARRAMRGVPAGTTVSYQELAALAGSPTAVRAAGTACATNPVPLFVPCHRIIRTDGTLGGYYYGLACKRWLLDHERGESSLFGEA